MELDCHVRWLIRADMKEVLDIEQRSFDYPWSEHDFEDVLRHKNAIGYVAEVGSHIAGYAIYEALPTRMHILNFAVAYDFRRSTIGTALVNRMKSKLTAGKRTRILLEVRETNVDAQLFWRAMGFKAVNTLRNYYTDTDEDAYLMQFRIPCAVAKGGA